MNHISLSITDNIDPLFQKIFCVPEGDTTAEGGGLTFLSSGKRVIYPQASPGGPPSAARKAFKFLNRKSFHPSLLPFLCYHLALIKTKKI